MTLVPADRFVEQFSQRAPLNSTDVTPRDRLEPEVVKAIEHNRAELEVAPLGLRLGATFAGVAPELAAAAARRLGSTKVAFDMADAQRGTH